MRRWRRGGEPLREDAPGPEGLFFQTGGFRGREGASPAAVSWSSVVVTMACPFSGHRLVEVDWDAGGWQVDEVCHDAAIGFVAAGMESPGFY